MTELSNEYVLYEDDNIYVFFRPLGDVLAISFNEMGYSSTTSGWGSNVFLGLGYSSLGFVSKKPNWFPVGSMENAIKSISPTLLNYSKRVSYGHSQGGYAAIKYSRPLGVNAILSFCPQFSIDPEDLAYNDTRFVGYFVAKGHSPKISCDDVAAEVPAYIFYDPTHSQDKFNVEKILDAAPTLKTIKVFGSGHSSVRPFASGKSIGELFSLALRGDTSGVRRLSYECKKKWVSRRAYLARSLVRIKQETAIAVLDGYHHLLNDESAPEIIGALYDSAKYSYLSQNGLKFCGVVNYGEVRNIFMAMIADDNLRDAIRLSAIQSLKFNAAPLITNQFQPKVFFEEQDWVSFCEGWSTPEQWGVWGVSVRSKIVIDWAKLPSSVSSVRIKVSQHIPGRAHISVTTSNDFKLDKRFLNVEGYVEVPRMGKITEVEFNCSELVSPRAEGFSKDSRFLGVKIFHPKTWL